MNIRHSSESSETNRQPICKTSGVTQMLRNIHRSLTMDPQEAQILPAGPRTAKNRWSICYELTRTGISKKKTITFLLFDLQGSFLNIFCMN